MSIKCATRIPRTWLVDSFKWFWSPLVNLLTPRLAKKLLISSWACLRVSRRSLRMVWLLIQASARALKREWTFKRWESTFCLPSKAKMKLVPEWPAVWLAILPLLFKKEWNFTCPLLCHTFSKFWPVTTTTDQLSCRLFARSVISVSMLVFRSSRFILRKLCVF